MLPRSVLSLLIIFAASIWGLYFWWYNKKLPPHFWVPLGIVTSALSALLYSFNRWFWKSSWVIYITEWPNLSGTWKGVLQSDFKRDGKTIDPIEVYVVIHQTFSKIHLRQFTLESESSSVTASIEKGNDKKSSIFVIYRNEPKREVIHRSPIHYGAMKLSLGGDNGDRLVGEYWTDRNTKGSLDLRLVERKEASDFQSAQKLTLLTSSQEQQNKKD